MGNATVAFLGEDLLILVLLFVQLLSYFVFLVICANAHTLPFKNFREIPKKTWLISKWNAWELKTTCFRVVLSFSVF